MNVTGAFSAQVQRTDVPGNSGAAIWQKLVQPNCNVFLVVNGHFTDLLDGEANRTDLNACGRPVHAALSDYQGRPNGGDGWLRYYTFTPAANEIRATTYSPTLNAYETDADSSFVLAYDMSPPVDLPELGRQTVASGAQASVPLPDLAPGTTFDWYATVSDGTSTTRGPTQSVTVSAPPPAGALAQDAFGRTVASGWGTADTGGPWTVNSTTKFSVASGTGRVAANAGSTLNATLGQVSATAIDARTSLADRQAPEPGAQRHPRRTRGRHLPLRRPPAHQPQRNRATPPHARRHRPVRRHPPRHHPRRRHPHHRPRPSRRHQPDHPPRPRLAHRRHRTHHLALHHHRPHRRPPTTRQPPTQHLPQLLGHQRPHHRHLRRPHRHRASAAPPPPPPNAPPTAAFTWTAAGLTVNADSTSSSDSDGTIASRSWDFDGVSGGSGILASRTFPAAGTYPVSLTVTDDDGATATTTQSVTVSAPPPAGALAQDAFGRTVASGWGTADTGGPWTVNSTTKFSVASGTGRVAANAGSTLNATLGQVSVHRDRRHAPPSRIDKLPEPSPQRHPRRTPRRHLPLRRPPAHQPQRIRATPPHARQHRPVRRHPPRHHRSPPAPRIRVRVQVDGTNPTTLRARAWPAAATEPTTWQFTTTDPTTALQQPGSLRLSTYLSSSATNGPITVTYDDLTATPLP